MQEIEIERKNLLTKSEYDRIYTNYNLRDEKKFKQINHYFETASFDLKDKGAALRIRENGGKYTMTLKEPYQDGLLETHVSLTETEAIDFQSGNQPLPKEIDNHLYALGVDPIKLRYGGKLETIRIEKQLDDLLLVLDESRYLGVHDYELEVEGSRVDQVEAFLNEVLTQLSITKKDTPNKIARFYKQLYSSDDHAF